MEFILVFSLKRMEKYWKNSHFTYSMSLRTHESNSRICFPMNHTKLLKYGAAVLKIQDKLKKFRKIPRNSIFVWKIVFQIEKFKSFILLNVKQLSTKNDSNFFSHVFGKGAVHCAGVLTSASRSNSHICCFLEKCAAQSTYFAKTR